MSGPVAWASRRGYFIVAAAALVLDQLSKLVVHYTLADRGAVEIIPGCFSLWYSRNPGGLFGSFREWSSPLRFVLLTVLPTLAVVFIAGFLRRGRIEDRPTLLGLSLILGGATGNLLDRLIRGEVIDFLDVYVSGSGFADWLIGRFGTAHWPTFNVADSAIVVGAGLLLLDILRPQRSDRSAGEDAAAAM
jgi:signal peptidase II